jgi:cell wall-associated NlpC family hydrolase
MGSTQKPLNNTIKKKALGSTAKKATRATAKKTTSQTAKTVAKKATKSAVKNSARASSLGTSIAVEALIALVATKTGRRVLLGIIAAMLAMIIAIFAAPLFAFDNGITAAGQLGSALTGQAEQAILQSTPGVPSKLPTAVLQPFEVEDRASNVPWEVLFAIAYYESLGGNSVANQTGACVSSASAPYCPPTSSVTLPPSKISVGPLGLNAKILRQYQISAASVSNLTGALQAVGGAISSYMKNHNVPQSANLLSGVTQTQTGPVYTATVNQQAYDTAMMSALSKLPLVGQSQTLDKNIFYLAQEWAAGSVTPSQSGGYGTDMICATHVGKTVTIADNSGGTMGLDAEQVTNAAIISNEAKAMGIPPEGVVIALMTGLQESSLFNLPNGNVPASLTNPNAQWGTYTPQNPPNNYGSLGVFQQRASWGTVNERLTVSYAASQFFHHMLGVKNWQTKSPGNVAQKVQVSAYPSAYAPWQAGASTLAGDVLGIKCSAGVSTANLTGVAKTVVTTASQFIGNTPYVWGGGTSLGPSSGVSGQGAVGPAGYAGKPGFDCSGLVLYAFSKAGITLPHYSGLGGQYSIVKASSTFTTNISQLKPGYIVFFVGQGDGGSVANPGHVGIYIGGGKMINAPAAGQLVSIAPVTRSSAGGFVGGGMPA